MKVLVALFVIVAIGSTSGGVVPATTLVRTPSFDSAIIKSDRVGGNFAYSTVEGHAYAAVSPVVQRVVEPVSVSYTAHQVPLGYVATPVAASYVPQPQQFQHVISAPSYLFGSPIFSYPGISFSPVATAPFYPGAPVAPVSGPVGGPVAPQPVADVPQAPTGTAIDEDTVSVESA